MLAGSGEQEWIAQLCRQRADHLRQHAIPLARQQLVVGPGRAVGDGVDEWFAAVVAAVLANAPEPGRDRAPPIERLAPRNTQQPGAERGGIVEAADAAPRGQTRV